MARYNNKMEADDSQKVSNVDLPATGPVVHVALDDKEDIEPIRVTPANEKLELLKFMEEPVEVMVAESTDPNAAQIVETWVNGVAQRFIRGQTQTVKRKYIEVLARAKKTAVRTREITDGDNNRTTRIEKSSALQYPFSIMNDPNPRGMAWLKNILAQ